ncbi:MAG: hypothetical protein AABY47_09560 [Pseudomonadota bacterium]
MRKYKVLNGFIAVILLMSINACAQNEIIPINEINMSPVNFDGKEVRLKGIPKNPTRVPLMNIKSYVLKDKSGEITILTESDLPKMNEEIVVRVKVESLAIIQGDAVGMTVIELERYK